MVNARLSFETREALAGRRGPDGWAIARFGQQSCSEDQGAGSSSWPPRSSWRRPLAETEVFTMRTKGAKTAPRTSRATLSRGHPEHFLQHCLLLGSRQGSVRQGKAEKRPIE